MKQKKKIGVQSNLLSFFNRAFVLLVICLIGWIGFKITQTKEMMPAPSFKLRNSVISQNLNMEFGLGTDRPFSYYQAELEKRNFFEAPWEKPVIDNTEVKLEEPPKPKVDLKTLITLVGIVLDNDPKAVIEDLKTQETVFLSIGEEINEAKLIEIHEDKIIFLYQEEKYEMVIE